MSRRWDEGTGVVTPEAVPLQFPEAGVGSRAISFFIDAILLTILLILLNVTIGYLYEGNGLAPGWVAVTALVLVNFLVFFGYPIAFETFTSGRTPGKMAMGLRVVTVEGSPVRFRHTAIRAALGLVDFFLTSGVGAVAASLFSRRHQRLGDMVAGTVVLRERTVAPPPRATSFPVPRGAEAYAATIDTAGLSPQDYEAVREYLLRRFSLKPQARLDIGRDLARALAAKLQHTAPASVHPELFLECVAARYQQRGLSSAPPPAPAFGAPPPPAAPPPPPPSALDLDLAPPASDPPAAVDPPAPSTDFAPPR